MNRTLWKRHIKTIALFYIISRCPVLRCPPQTDRVRELLIRLAGIIRGSNPTAERISRMAAKVGQTLMATIPEPILTEINSYANQGVKLIGDTPLELLPVDGVPLALSLTESMYSSGMRSRSGSSPASSLSSLSPQ